MGNSGKIIAIATFLTVAEIHAQGRVTFNTALPPNQGIALTSYSEGGMLFTGIGGAQFGLSGGAPANTAFPRNGSGYLFGSFTYSLSVTRSGGVSFGVVSVDMAEYSTLYQTPLVVDFVGYRLDGSTVMTQFTTDGIIDGAGPLNDFETFFFDSRFDDVRRVEIPTYGWSLDNFVFAPAVPEPSTISFVVVAGLIFVARSRSTKHVPPGPLS